MTWDEKAADAAIEYAKPTIRPVQTMSDHMADAFHDGARWQREALLSDETIEKAARALYELAPYPEWAEGIAPIGVVGWEDVDDKHRYRDMARLALTAAIGDE